MTRKPLHPAASFGALVALLATLPAVFVAWLTRANGCEPICPNGLVTTQLIVAVAGVVPAAVLVYACGTGRRRLALVALAVGIIVYAGWGLLNDASLHGWGNLFS
jgi:hypothetical protein